MYIIYTLVFTYTRAIENILEISSFKSIFIVRFSFSPERSTPAIRSIHFTTASPSVAIYMPKADLFE